MYSLPLAYLFDDLFISVLTHEYLFFIIILLYLQYILLIYVHIYFSILLHITCILYILSIFISQLFL